MAQILLEVFADRGGDTMSAPALLSKRIWNSLVSWSHPLNSGGSLRDANMRLLEQHDAVQDAGQWV